jgi:hypothetical protein
MMDDRLDIRQRRAIATSHSYPDPNPNSADNTDIPAPLSISPFPALTSRWRTRRKTATLPLRFAMWFVEVASLAIAMLIVPSTIQYLVRSVDELNEITGRRSRSPFASISGSRVLAGTVAFLVWHVVVLGLGYLVLGGIDGEEDAREAVLKINAGTRARDGRTTASRIVGRVLLPSYIALCVLGFFYRLATHLVWPNIAISSTDGLTDADISPSLH